MHLFNLKRYTFVLALVLICVPSFSSASSNTGYHIDKKIDLVPNNPKGNKKVILITIDDGPSKYATGMAETLTKHHAKAIFFINGTHDKKNPGVIASLHKSGFTIGSHTWDHANLKLTLNIEKVKKEIDSNTALIIKETGSAPHFFRPPYGISTVFVKEYVKKNGMISMNWSGAALDWEKNTKDEKVFIKNVMNGLHGGEILLIHEHEWTAKHLDTLLTTLEQKGYTFVDPADITE